MSGKKYSVDEANALLPHLAPALVELRQKFDEAAQIRATIARAASLNGGSHRREEWSRLLARVAELMDRLKGWEVELRDVSTGLVDFPTVIAGEDAYLCWRLGEEEVAYWHPTDTGFAGRQPL